MCTAAVAEVPHVEPLEAVVPQLPGVAQALQNGVHEALQETTCTSAAEQRPWLARLVTSHLEPSGPSGPEMYPPTASSASFRK